MDSKAVSGAYQLRNPGDITTTYERAILIVAVPVADAVAAAEVPVAVRADRASGRRLHSIPGLRDDQPVAPEDPEERIAELERELAEAKRDAAEYDRAAPQQRRVVRAAESRCA